MRQTEEAKKKKSKTKGTAVNPWLPIQAYPLSTGCLPWPSRSSTKNRNETALKGVKRGSMKRLKKIPTPTKRKERKKKQGSRVRIPSRGCYATACRENEERELGGGGGGGKGKLIQSSTTGHSSFPFTGIAVLGLWQHRRPLHRQQRLPSSGATHGAKQSGGGGP